MCLLHFWYTHMSVWVCAEAHTLRSTGGRTIDCVCASCRLFQFVFSLSLCVFSKCINIWFCEFCFRSYAELKEKKLLASKQISIFYIILFVSRFQLSVWSFVCLAVIDCCSLRAAHQFRYVYVYRYHADRRFRLPDKIGVESINLVNIA